MSKIREAREAKGITRKYLSEWLEMPYRTLENYESGKNPTPKYLEKLILNEISRMKGKEKSIEKEQEG